MTAIEIVANLSSKGVKLESDNGALVVNAPEGVLDEVMWQTLAEKKPVILPLLAQGWEVGWRAAAMIPQIPENGAIPFLVARKSANQWPQACLSCGEPISAKKGYICDYCSRAKNLALDMVMRCVQVNQN